MRALMLACLLPAAALAQLGSASANVRLNLEAACELRAVSTTTSTPVTENGTTRITGTTSFLYLVRTNRLDGSGELRLRLPVLPPLATITFQTELSGTGQPLSSLSPSSETAPLVARFGANAHSSDAGNSASIRWAISWPGGQTDVSGSQTTPIVSCR